MKFLITIFSIVPFLFTIVLFLLFKKMGMKNSKAVSLSADFTTPFLLLAIPVIFQAVWDKSIFLLYILALLIIAIIMTYIEWRKKKEIYIPILLRKIWRTFFLVLAMLYVIIMFVGIIYWIYQYMTN